MPTRDKEIELLARLKTLVEGHHMGLTATVGDCGGVLIERRGHMRGIWRCMDGVLAWTPAGYNEPVHIAADVGAAVAYTSAVISK